MSLDLITAALATLFGSPTLLAMIALAVPLGLAFGAVPGLGGKLGIVLLIPLLFGMEPLHGAVLILAMHAVVHTGGSIPSILLGVPGTGVDAATVVDGYPMTQKGEGGRALGASLMASGAGGVIGAIALAVLLPAVEPLVLSMGPAEFFLMALFGITFISALSGDRLVKGLIVGFFGLMISFVGRDLITGTPRYTFDQHFLWDGIGVIGASVGIFAVPEMIALGGRGGSIAKDGATRPDLRQVLAGMMDVVDHWWLGLRTAVIGAVIGAIPGLGGSVASWFCYGHAVQSSKTPERFGKGAVEGVIAPETANNSKEGGALLPTLFFGIPGSSSMALMLGAFALLGIHPGPAMMTDRLDLVWILIVTLVVANLFAVAVCLAITPWISLVAYLRGGLVIPVVLLFSILGVLISTGNWQSLSILLFLGLIGWGLHRYGWPRPPFIIGVVLGATIEQSLLQAWSLWGWDFLLRPLSMVLVALIVGSIGLSAFQIWRRGRGT